ncbi:MAG: transglycosylase domain-containing protein [Coriobacteriia bacterium]
MSRRRARQRRRPRKPYAKIALAVGLALIAGVVTAAIVGGVVLTNLFHEWTEDLPDYTSDTAFDLAQPTRIYSADGVLLAKLYLQNREVVSISQVSTDLVNGVVAVEDERFYQHKGVDPYGLVRAAVSNVISKGTRVQGASTITQQLVRNTVLIDEAFDITYRRKVREAYVALEIEKRFSKREILEMYLNSVYLGENSYGAQAAAKTYFAKDAKDLTLAESATIAGLAQAPSRLDPYNNPEAATTRRNLVLSRMLTNGYITQAEYDAAIETPLVLKRASDPDNGIYAAPYFVAEVKRQLQQQFPQSVVFGGGLTVYTTLDMTMQGYAEAAAHATFRNPQDPEVALVSIDPRNGYVKALVGGRDYTQSKFNLATQALRQPGSSFKTFVLATAISQGMPPTFEIDSSAPAVIPMKPKDWVVRNSEGNGSGMMTVAKATSGSVNAVFARLGLIVGIPNVVQTAKTMGITTEIPAYASIALGSAGVRPIDMASAYGTLANGGVHYNTMMITQVTDRRGNSIYQAEPSGTQALSPEVSYAVTKVLKTVITNGTARRANIGRPAAGKTGTSQDNRDAWFVGYTPQLVTAVWVGHPTERTIYVKGSRAYGGTVAAPIWAAFMKQALADQEALDFPVADDPPYNPKHFNTGYYYTLATGESRKTPKKSEDSEGKVLAPEATAPKTEPDPSSEDTSGSP